MKLFGSPKTQRKNCGCNNCITCKGNGRIWDIKTNLYNACEECKARGATVLCFTHAEKALWLKPDDISRHDQYIRKQAA